MSKRRFEAWVLGLVLGLCLLCQSRESRADLSDAIYSDAKDVIEDLISAEVARQIPPGIACLSGQRPTTDKTRSVSFEVEDDKKVKHTKTIELEATKHFPKTLQHIYNRQFGSLRATVKQEAANLAGFLVYQALHTPTLHFRAHPADVAKLAADAKNAADQAAAELLRTTAALTKAANDCPTDPENDSACGGGNEAAKASLTFASMDSSEFMECKKAVAARFDNGDWGRVATTPLEDACGGAESFECDVAFAVRCALLGQAASAQDSLLKATAVMVKELATKIYGQNTAVLEAIQQQVLFLLRQELTGDAWSATPLEERLTAIAGAIADISLAKLLPAERSEFIAAILQDNLPKAAALLAKAKDLKLKVDIDNFVDKEAQAILRPLANLMQLISKVEQLHAAWRSAIDVDLGKLDVAAFVRTIIGKSGPLVALCQANADHRIDDQTKKDVLDYSRLPACRVIVAISEAKTGGVVEVSKALNQIQPFLSFAGRGEYAEAAQMSVRYVFQLVKDKDSEVSVYERFAESVVTYVLESSDEKTPSEAARVAFKAAAVDLIQHLAQGGGLRRRAWSIGHLWKLRAPTAVPFFLPDLALRASWSPSYINKDTSPTRVLASVSFMTLRFPIHRTEASYVGTQLSLIDPLAPLSELVLRKTDGTHYSKVNSLFANFFTPRIEVIAGSPALSEHLALSGGISLRLAGPVPDAAATIKNNGEPSYKYDLVWDAQDKDKDSLWLRFLEFGFAVKYVI